MSTDDAIINAIADRDAIIKGLLTRIEVLTDAASLAKMVLGSTLLSATTYEHHAAYQQLKKAGVK